MRNKSRYARRFWLSLDALEHDPVLNRQVNVFRVYFRSERIADKTSMEYVHAKQLSALLAKQILKLKLEKQRAAQLNTLACAPSQGRAHEY